MTNTVTAPFRIVASVATFVSGKQSARTTQEIVDRHAEHAAMQSRYLDARLARPGILPIFASPLDHHTRSSAA